MNLVQVKCFLAVAKLLNFTDAAKSLYMTQQAVSKQVLNLEQELGIQLFERGPAEIRLTEAGKRYNNLFSNQIEIYHRVLSDVQHHYQSMSSRFRIGYSVWIDPYGKIDEALCAFCKNHPLTVFSAGQYHNNQLMNELTNGQLDIAILSGGQVRFDSDFGYAAISQERVCLYAPQTVSGDTIDKQCWGLPFLRVPSWDWNYLMQKRIFDTEMQIYQTNFGIEPKEIRLLPNVQSMFAELAMQKYVTICDDRFSCASKVPGLKRFPLEITDSYLYCIWNPDNENPLIHKYVSYMTQYLK